MADNSLSSVAAAGGKLSGGTRVIHVYSVPVGVENPFREIELKELTAQENILASKLYPDGATQEEQMQILCKCSIATIDGAPVNIASAEFELMWEKVHPKIRNMLKTAVTAILVPTPKESEEFFQSHKVRVG